MNVIFRSDLAEAQGLRPRHVDGALVVNAKPVSAFLGSGSDTRAEVKALRIAADERLRQNHELGAFTGWVPYANGEFIDGARWIEGN